MGVFDRSIWVPYPPNFAVDPVTLNAILYPQPDVDIRYSRRLAKNSDAMKLKWIFQLLKAFKNLAIFSRCTLVIFLNY